MYTPATLLTKPSKASTSRKELSAGITSFTVRAATAAIRRQGEGENERAPRTVSRALMSLRHSQMRCGRGEQHGHGRVGPHAASPISTTGSGIENRTCQRGSRAFGAPQKSSETGYGFQKSPKSGKNKGSKRALYTHTPLSTYKKRSVKGRTATTRMPQKKRVDG